MTKPVDAAYIHIPFCKKICHYCAFNKYFYDGQPIGRYLDALNLEFSLYLKGCETNFDTIYVGGGTPSCLSLEEMEILLRSIQRYLPYDQHTEYTFEINPGELSIEKCQLLAQFGVNRVSMGVQSFNDKLLRKIGRNHREQHIYQSIEWLRSVGIENLSIDLIFRLPDQTLEDFDDSLTKALSLNLPHYSLYSLLIENNTLFQQLQREGKLLLPSQDLDADMFELAISKLKARGIMQYEVSNFALSGFESRHNLKYWSYRDYYGFGAGAHGFVNQERYHNFGPVHHYLKALDQGKQPIIESLVLSKEEQMEEYLFLALRTNAGFHLNEFEKRFGQKAQTIFSEFLLEKKSEGLLEMDTNRVRLNRKGLFLADSIFRDLLGILTGA